MIRILLICLLLTSCAHSTNTIQAQAVTELSKKYDMSECDHRLRIIKLGPKMPGFFDEYSGRIYIISDDPVVLDHEIKHYYLWHIGVPTSEHHKKMKELSN